MENFHISLIVPVHNDQEHLQFLLERILIQTLMPFELVVVDSSDSPYLIAEQMRQSISASGIDFKYIHSEPLNPGGARNLGVQSSRGELVGFLDVRTIPDCNWLADTVGSLERSKTMGVLGRTVYRAKSRLEQRIRAATYGVKPITTIPGSLFRREVFSTVGAFLSSVRAGEDRDWLLRARLHALRFPASQGSTITYVGLVGLSFRGLVRKWFRNYTAAKNIPYMSDHRVIYLLAFNLLLILIAANWNATVAHWDESSPNYVSHITKLTGALLFFVYILYRGVYIPLRRGVSLRYLFPREWMYVFFIGFSIDIVKFISFFPSVSGIFSRVLARSCRLSDSYE